MHYKPVLTKADFVRRFVANEFGNKGPNWHTLEEWRASGYMGLVHIRARIPGGRGEYNVPHELVEDRCATFKPGDYYLAAMAPHHRNRLQGEVSVLNNGLHLRYSDAPNVAMRDAFALGTKQVDGIMAVSLLRANLCPNSFEWLNILLERYPGHVVEFSCFGCNWGTLPHYNTVFWEVRNY